MSSVLAMGRSARYPGSLLFIGGLLCAPLAFLVPDHIPPWLAFRAEALAFAGLAIALLGMHLSGRGRDGPHPLTLLIAAFSVFPWLQWGAGIHPYAGDALLSWFYLAGAAMAVHLGTTIASEPNRNTLLNTAMAFLAVGAVASSAIGVVQWFGIFESGWIVDASAGSRASGNLAQPNHLATVCLAGVVAIVWLHHRGLLGRLAFLSSLGIVTAGVALSQSRTGLLSAYCLVGLSFFLRPRVITALNVGGVLAWLLALSLAWIAAPRLAGLLQLGQARELFAVASDGRWEIWRKIIDGILQRPLLGYGWNQTTVSHMAGAGAGGPGGITTTHAHNIALDLAAWVGIPMASLLLIACIYWIWTRVRALREPEAAFAFLTLVPFAVHSFLEFPFAYAYFLIPAAIAVGVVEAHYVRTTLPIPRTPFIALYVLWVGLGAGIAFEYQVIESEYREVRFAAARIGRPSTVDGHKALVLNTHMRSMIDAAKTRIRPDMPEDELANLERACNRFPYSSLTMRCAIAFALNDRPALAAATMERYRHIFGAAAYEAASHVYAHQLQVTGIDPHSGKKVRP
ncbi:Wzy polymerase domain-containing protein [Ramlibacter sp. AN1015]|uniref:PglL family O-oligosaccharyltransferase n=1 Tax=Ramlibacter sp. AN1015 TaxID=3133428 RepID=UPI0030C37B97